jgi:hypothetical protein
MIRKLVARGPRKIKHVGRRGELADEGLNRPGAKNAELGGEHEDDPIPVDPSPLALLALLAPGRFNPPPWRGVG